MYNGANTREYVIYTQIVWLSARKHHKMALNKTRKNIYDWQQYISVVHQ